MNISKILTKQSRSWHDTTTSDLPVLSLINNGFEGNNTPLEDLPLRLNSSLNEPNTSVHNVSSWLWIILSPIILALGLFGNSLIIYILIRCVFWKKLTYIFLFILAILDMIVLSTGLCRRWLMVMFDLDVRTMSDMACKTDLFLVYFSMQLSSWTLVFVTTERFIRISFPLKFIALNISRKLLISYMTIVLTCIFINSHFFLTNGLVITNNRSSCNNTSEDYYIFEEKYFTIIDLLVLSVIPFTVMLPMNITIWTVLKRSRLFRTNLQQNNQCNEKYNRKSKKLTRMLLFTNLYFLISTLPVSIFFVVDFYIEEESSWYSLATTTSYLLQFTNYSANFFIYVVINSKFRQWIQKDKLCSFCRIHNSKSFEINSITKSDDTLPADTLHRQTI